MASCSAVLKLGVAEFCALVCFLFHSYFIINIQYEKTFTWEKNWPPWLLTDCSRWPKWSQPAVTEPWLSCDLAVTEPWSYWRCRDWAVTSPWLSCDLAVTELWPRRDWAVTSTSHDWAVIIGPGAVTTVVTVSSRWQFFSYGFLRVRCRT